MNNLIITRIAICKTQCVPNRLGKCIIIIQSKWSEMKRCRILAPAINYNTEYLFNKQLGLHNLIDHHLINACEHGEAFNRKGMKRNFQLLMSLTDYNLWLKLLSPWKWSLTGDDDDDCNPNCLMCLSQCDFLPFLLNSIKNGAKSVNSLVVVETGSI